MEVKVKSNGILFPVHSEEKAFVHKTRVTLSLSMLASMIFLHKVFIPSPSH